VYEEKVVFGLELKSQERKRSECQAFEDEIKIRESVHLVFKHIYACVG
jgi:hypothetical protein